jgi:hypothetical protein
LRTIGHYLKYDKDILVNCPCRCGLFYFGKQLQKMYLRKGLIIQQETWNAL